MGEVSISQTFHPSSTPFGLKEIIHAFTVCGRSLGEINYLNNTLIVT